MARKTKTQKPAATQSDGAKSDHSRFWKYSSVLILTGVILLAWLSVLTFDPTDTPSPVVSQGDTATHNAAGRVGAYISYNLHYWLGGGVYLGLIFGSVAAVMLMLGGKVSDLPWRLGGISLVIVTASGGLYLIDPAGSVDVYRGSAGIVGTSLGEFLGSKFANGAWLILGVGFCIGLMFAADAMLIRAFKFCRTLIRNRGKGSVRPAAVKTPAAKPATPVSQIIVEAKRVSATKIPEKIAPARKGLAAMLPGFNKSPAKPKSKPAARPAASPKPTARQQDYQLPSTELLAVPQGGYIESQTAQAAHKRDVLQQTFNDFNIAAEVVGHMTGPVITMYEVSLSPGVKVSQIAGLAMDIARALAVPGVRIVPPRFGKDTIGIEVPNVDKEIVRIRELMELRPDADTKMHLPLYLGKDAAGDAIVADLATMPHMLIAGTTGSGKSVCINTILVSLLMLRRPEEVRLILVDPKMVEMAAFENIPHLLCPIVNDMRKAEDILEWAAIKMDERYDILKEAGVKNLSSYNKLGAEKLYERLGVTSDEEKARIPLTIPRYVIIIDELADLMMTSSKEVESHIIRIAQKARAVGIHLVLATQRPSVNVVTGLIKSNMPCRISFRVASRQESRIVLDQNGAEVLLGRGDMLVLQPGDSHLSRAQGAFVDDTEIRPVVEQLKKIGDPNYNAELMKLQSKTAGDTSGEKDDLFDKSVEIVLATQRGSVSLLQRRLQIGYSRASRIIDQMAEAGLLGEYKGSQARECLMTLDEWHEFQNTIASDQSGASAYDGTPTSV